jgi:MFS family permease
VGQPFVLNAITKVAATWFPARERATANGFPVLAQFVGIIIAFMLSPLLLKQTAVGGAASYNIPHIVMVYGYASLAGAIPFLVFARRAAIPLPDEVAEAELPFSQALGRLLRQRDMILLSLLFFIGLGLFNAISTLIELILIPKGLGKVAAGQVGALMMAGGIIGAIVLPALSDRLQKRKEIVLLCMIGLIPGLVGLTFATGYGLLMASSLVLGFFLIGSAPIAFQYGAEVSRPVPEGASQGMILLAGQVGGILFITLVGLMGHISVESLAGVARSSTNLTFFMVGFIALAIANVFVCLRLRKSATAAGG